jgi:hypothetical protein
LLLQAETPPRRLAEEELGVVIAIAVPLSSSTILRTRGENVVPLLDST